MPQVQQAPPVFRVQLVCKVQQALPVLVPLEPLVFRVPQDLVQLVLLDHKASQEPLGQLQQQVPQVPPDHKASQEPLAQLLQQVQQGLQDSQVPQVVQAAPQVPQAPQDLAQQAQPGLRVLLVLQEFRVLQG